MADRLQNIALRIFNEAFSQDDWAFWEEKLKMKEEAAKARDAEMAAEEAKEKAEQERRKQRWKTARRDAQELLQGSDNEYGMMKKLFQRASSWKKASVDQLKKYLKLNPGFYITMVDRDSYSSERIPPIKITEPVTNSAIIRSLEGGTGRNIKGERSLGFGRKGANYSIPFKSISSVRALKQFPEIITFNFEESNRSRTNTHAYSVLVTPDYPDQAILVAFDPLRERHYDEDND